MKPRQPLLIILALLLLASLAGSLLRLDWEASARVFNLITAGALGVFLIICISDYLTSRHRLRLTIRRTLPEHMVLERDIPVRLQIFCPQQGKVIKPFPAKIADCLPPDWHTDTPELNVEILPGRGIEVGYTARSHRRGDTAFSGIDYAVPSRFGLWWMTTRLPAVQEVKVLPDFSRILGADLLGFQHWLNLMGAKKNRRRGEGQEFHQLRDFMDGDAVRHIDWKATARARKPIVRTFQDERDRQIIFLLDCSRAMSTVSGTLNHFDYALNAMLLLSYTALKHDDAVGLMTFNAPQERFLPPRRGMAQIGKVIDTVYDIEPSLAAADMENAVPRLMQRQTRRSLVIVLSHLSHDADDGLIATLHRLARRHLVLIANLRQTVAADIQAHPPHDADEALTYIGAQFYRQEEAHSLARLNSSNIPYLHVLPHELSTALINRYMQMKRDGAW